MKKSKNLDKQTFRQATELGLSLTLAMGMLVYGIGKVRQFTGVTAPDKLLVDFTGMELMWAFYRYSQPYVYFIGGLEVLGGVLLLFKRTRVLACLLLTSILTNIILQDIFYNVYRGALVTALFYQTLALVILYLNKTKVIATFHYLIRKENVQSKSFYTLIVGVLLFIVIRIFEYYLTTILN